MNFLYDGKNSKDFNLIITKVKRYDTPERNIETLDVPGRDGSITIDNGSYSSRRIEVEAYIKSDIKHYSRLINAWLYKNFENKQLIFDDEADIYYLGKCINKISFEESFRYFNSCKFIFECMPYKYLSDGENILTINNENSQIYNPTEFDSKPTIKIYASGDISLTINNIKINLKDINEYVILDSELMDCYKDTVLMNNKMQGEFPNFKAGINHISCTGSINKIEITPKWRWL